MKFVNSILFLCLSGLMMAGVHTRMTYSVEEIGGGRWAYTYMIENITLDESIEEFTVWFPLGQYDNLVPESPAEIVQDWNELFWNPNIILNEDGGYDVLANSVVLEAGQSVEGFRVSFDWIGVGIPGSQHYEIIDPVTFETIESGFTVIPEPMSMGLWVMVFSGLYVRRVSRKG